MSSGKIVSTYNPDSYMTPVLYSESDAIFSGVTLLGPGGLGAVGACGPCAIRASGKKHVEFENGEIGHFAGGGIWFGDGNPNITVWNDDKQRSRVHHSYIHHIQRHGFGYGVGVQGATQSVLIEANLIDKCRHLVMGQAGSNSWHLRYNIFGDSLYGYQGSATNLYHNQQVDSHGDDSGNNAHPAGYHRICEFNTFSDNWGTTHSGNHQNVAIRGIPGVECIVRRNWTKKTTHAGKFTETSPTNSAFEQRSIKGGEFIKMLVEDNWYGVDPNPEYGHLVYDQTNKPIGGGAGYVSQYRQSLAHYIVENLADLTKALAEAKSGNMIWIPDDVVITITGVYGKVVKSGVILAAGRGTAGEIPEPPEPPEPPVEDEAKLEITGTVVSTSSKAISVEIDLANAGTKEGTAKLTDGVNTTGVVVPAGGTHKINLNVEIS